MPSMEGLRAFVGSLRPPDEKPVEPDLKQEKQEKDRKIREEQDLEAGAVLEAVVEQGSGGGDDETPSEGDLVYVHYSVLSAEDDLLFSTRADEGGSGQPLAFVVGKKGWRAPRAWELALLGMTKGMRKRLRVSNPAYGYAGPDCRVPPPPGVAGAAADGPLGFELTLVAWHAGSGVRALGEHADVLKRVLVDSDRWELARPPNHVTFGLELRAPAHDGAAGAGFLYHDSPADSAPLRLQLGSGALPPGLEAALCSMSKGETALFVVPADQMRYDEDDDEDDGGDKQGDKQQQQQQRGQKKERRLIPPPPARAAQVEARVSLVGLVQVRDMTGDGSVTKRRVREGTGEFPVDCPLHDTTVRLHYRARQQAAAASAGGGGGGGGCAPASDAPWAFDSRGFAAAEGAVAAGASEAAAPVEVDTGCGELPEGLEMVVKLMVPGEVAVASCAAKYAYEGRSDAPPGIDPASPVEFEVELVSFEREGYWQGLGWEERWALAERVKQKGNELFRARKFEHAAGR